MTGLRAGTGGLLVDGGAEGIFSTSVGQDFTRGNVVLTAAYTTAGTTRFLRRDRGTTARTQSHAASALDPVTGNVYVGVVGTDVPNGPDQVAFAYSSAGRRFWRAEVDVAGSTEMTAVDIAVADGGGTVVLSGAAPRTGFPPPGGVLTTALESQRNRHRQHAGSGLPSHLHEGVHHRGLRPVADCPVTPPR